MRKSTPKRTGTSNCWISAYLHGDNYLFFVTKNNSPIIAPDIKNFAELAASQHCHKVIVVPGNSKISDSAQNCISQYSMQIWNEQKLQELSHKADTSLSDNDSQVSPLSTPLQNIAQNVVSSSAPDDPIQDGSRANSIFGNLFNNKIQKL